MRALVVTADVPWPSIGGARTRNAHLAAALAERHEVTVLAFDWGGSAHTPPPGISLRTVAWELPEVHRALERGDRGAMAPFDDLDAEPWGVSYYDSPAMDEMLRAIAAELEPDVVVLTETAMARFRGCLPDGVPFMLDLHDVHAAKQRRAGDPDQAERIRRFEAAAVQDAAMTVCVSETEARAACSLLGAKRLVVVPNGVDTTRFRQADGPGESDRIVFTGSLHTAENVAAVRWFVHEVLPTVVASRPSVHLDVVGSKPATEVLALAGDGVEVHGDVPSTVPFLHRAGVVVIPLLAGGGTRLKALEAVATGRAVVTTSIGIEGLPFEDRKHVDVADEPRAFADAVLRLCRSPVLRSNRAVAARDLVDEFDWSRVGKRWCDVLESVARRSS